MNINKLRIGSIIEDFKTNSIYEIITVTEDYGYNGRSYNYAVNILVNPLDIRINIIKIARINQLASLHFYNVDNVINDSSGLVDFTLGTMSEENSAKLTDITIFVKNYFYKERFFKQKNKVYSVFLEDLIKRTVLIKRDANFLERLFFSKETITKIIPITSLFEEYVVFIPD